jgi:tRNA pseudouridine55 synthase
VKGILLFDKPEGFSSFFFIPRLRRLFDEKKIGHAGTLDPFATGLMIYLVGKDYTRLAQTFLNDDKVYECHFHLGVETNTYDLTGQTIIQSSFIPSKEGVTQALAELSGEQLQVPPMFSAKKIEGKKLYELARIGQRVERLPCPVNIEIKDVEYRYPLLKLTVHCSKGTYIRSLAHDLGQLLGCGAHVSFLRRTTSGRYHLNHAVNYKNLFSNESNLNDYLITQEF